MEFSKGRYRVRFARTQPDRDAVLRLRSLAFRNGSAPDLDAYDSLCDHVMVELSDGQLVCCFRLLPLKEGKDISKSYSAQFYGLERLAGFNGPMVEMGRFCIRPGETDPDILRVAWAAMTRFVDAEGVELLFGCSSFHGTEAESYRDSFALLRERHMAPSHWRPMVKAPSVIRFAQWLRDGAGDPKRALRLMPPLLRSYLALGGWVSDHAVVDRDLNTLHVFTAVEIRAIPPNRARLMRAVGA